MKYATEGDYLDGLLAVAQENDVEFAIKKDKEMNLYAVYVGDFEWFAQFSFCEEFLFDALVNAKAYFISKNKQ